MSIKSGNTPYMGVGIEVTPGTGVQASKWIPYVSCTLLAKQEPLFDESAKGVRDKNYASSVGKLSGSGDVEIYMDVENAMYFLYPALGEKTTVTAAGETTVWEHTLTRKSANPPKTVTIVYNDTVDTRKYTYGVVNSFDLNVVDGLATLSANILTKFPTTATGTLALTTERIMSFKDYSIKFGSGATGTAALVAAAAANATPVSSFSLKYNNNAEMQFMSGSGSPASISMGALEVDGEYVIFYENTNERAFYETMLYGVDPVRAMIVTFTGDSIGSAETEEIQIKIPNFKLKDKGLDAAISGFITENPQFIAMYDPNEAKTIQIKVTNSTHVYN
jgi:hypothetical protein